MKSLLPPILLLAAILGFSLWNCSAVTRQTEQCILPLEQAGRLAAEEGWSGAAGALRDSYDRWNSRQTFLHIVEEHDAVDGAEAMYRRAAAFAQTRETSEFLAEVADLCNQLRLLAEMEQFSVRNIL